MQFVNPILPGFYPDPSICRVDEDYYLVTSTFHYSPGVPIFHSRDLVNWKQIGHCLNRASQLDLTHAQNFMGIFAPTLRYINGYFYMITTNVITLGGPVGGNFYVRASNPQGPWSDPVWLEWPGIDPSLFCDEDGRVYITGTNGFSDEEPGIYQAEIEIDSGKLMSPRRLVWKGTGGKSPEGPHLYRIQDEYYLIIAEGGTEYGHMVTLARSHHPFGPFKSNPENPILSHRSLRSSIQATGHADIVQAHDGSWWAVCLGIRPVSRRHHLGRETYLAPISWSGEGWPVIGVKGCIDLQMEGPSFLLEEPLTEAARDHFLEPKLKDTWNFLRNPNAADWSLTERPGWLTLRGTNVTLDDLDSPAFVGRRQQHMKCRVSTLLEFQADHDGDEAGLTAIMNERFHYEIALARMGGMKHIILRKRVGSLWKVEKASEYSGERVTLEIEADPQVYTFSFYDHTGKKNTLGQGECGLLSSEVAGGFTGIYFGLYATGNGGPACFDWFDYVVNK
ncbi:glycoside hydrolase family 43 protein [Paenibacillus sp. S150]|uniref:glycoside hydrolase family 43 protein n=1 Tax=Paenibacillus sp. S150 TaxID=2749826 RepID=UPI001C58A2F1|nr:glycoside hydrolase family 43 protein [Paenibacillus sp. S150]MBW4079950.1 glycoside hydrolase family 43 protein [Paenibacillus sp. S150]